MKKLTIREIALCAIFTALIAVGAFIRIPVPVVPFTLQTLFVVLAGMLLGPVLGTFSALAYLLLGLIGLPIFTQGGGIFYVLKPSFGYILGFVIGAWVTGRIARAVPSPGFVRLLLAGLAGLFVIYFCGVVYYWLISALYLGKEVSARTLLVYCFLVFIPGDAASCAVAAELSRRLLPVLRKKQAVS